MYRWIARKTTYWLNWRASEGTKREKKKTKNNQLPRNEFKSLNWFQFHDDIASTMLSLFFLIFCSSYRNQMTSICVRPRKKNLKYRNAIKTEIQQTAEYPYKHIPTPTPTPTHTLKTVHLYQEPYYFSHFKVSKYSWN